MDNEQNECSRLERGTAAGANRTESSEQNVYAAVYRVLIGGMLVSCALFAFGIVRALQHPKQVQLTRAAVQHYYHWGVFWPALRALDPEALMLVATVILILTPVSRVVASAYAFWVDRDWRFVMVTSVVFGVIVLTVVLARLGLH